MKKLILLIGLLTYSSVGWSESLIMKCDVEDRSQGEMVLEFYKMETNESESSSSLLSRRYQGNWENMCQDGCRKGDLSVIRNGLLFTEVYDFRFKLVTLHKKEDPSSVVRFENIKSMCKEFK